MNTIKQLKVSLICTSMSILLTACGGSGGNDPQPVLPVEPTPIVVDYQKLIDETVTDSIPGIVLLVETPDNKFLGSAGVENIADQNPMQSYHTMPTASAGKPMIALLATILADDNLLNLDEPISTWLSDDILSQIAHSDVMTLRQLLNHTSGIYNYVDNDDYIHVFLDEPEKLKTDIDFLSLGLNQQAYFKPGEGQKYSNTGYLLAGLILDNVLGEHHSAALRERILVPLGMNATYYRGIEKEQGDFISGYHIDEGETYETKPYLENVAQASAPVVSSVEDMALFLKRVVVDQSFINSDIRNDYFGSESLNGFIGKESLSGNTAYGHSGLTYGYHTQNIYLEEKELSITAFINCSTQPLCENTMDSLVKEVLANELD